MYTALPPQESATVSRRVAPTHRNGHCHQSKNSEYITVQRFGEGGAFCVLSSSLCVCVCVCVRVCVCVCVTFMEKCEAV